MRITSSMRPAWQLRTWRVCRDRCSVRRDSEEIRKRAEQALELCRRGGDCPSVFDDAHLQATKMLRGGMTQRVRLW